LEELTEYGDIFSMKSDDCGWTDSVPPYRYAGGPTDSPTSEETPLAKQADVGEMLEYMQ
jgi:hypothetical protein